MDLSTVANGWVSSYLEALMSAGLSSEHVKTETPVELPNPEGQRADRSVCAKYYVNQILSMDEQGIKGAWKRSTCGAGAPEQQSEKDARLAYLSWRVWGMKRKRSEVRAVMEAERQMSMVEEDEEEASLAQLTSFSLADLSKIVPNPLPIQQQSFTSRRNLEALLSHGSFNAAQAPQEHRQPSRAHMPNPLVVQEEDSESNSTFAEAPSWSSPEPPGKTALTRVTDPIERIPRLYIVLISMHGLIRGKEMELGRDPDTGGQVKYVVELAKALGRMPNVLRVDLLTRMVDGPGIDPCYAAPEEALMANSDAGGLGGSFIVRVPCGPPKTYLRKEELWPHVREFADWSIAYISDKLTQLQTGEGGQPSAELHVVHGHYADAGETASLVAHTLGVDMVLTGHSLGRNKRDFLIKQGTMRPAEIEETYAMTRRIEGEERALDAAMQVITSTQEEIDKQWGLYDGYNGQLGSALRNRPCKGYHVPDTLVIPPGLDFSNLKVKLAIDPWELVLGPQKDQKSDGSSGASPSARASIGGSDSVSSTALRIGAPRDTVEAAAEVLKNASLEPSAKQRNASRDTLDQASSQPSFQAPPSRGSMSGGTGHQTPHGQAEPPIWTEIGRFLRNPRKPAILTMCRADAKKNVTSLIHAYGQNKLLREISNLVLILGNRDTIDGLSTGSAQVMSQVLKLVDMYDLYGSVAYPKHHQQTDISDIYLFAAATKGVFINPALQEPFGLTLIEAAAHGVPTVATKHGGPVDIVETLQNGLLVEPTNPTEIGECLVRIVTNPEVWEQYSKAGSTNIVAYSWPSHCMQYLRAIGEEKEKPVIMPNTNLRPSLSEEELTLNKMCDMAIETRTLSMPASRLGDGGFSLLSPGPNGTPRGLPTPRGAPSPKEGKGAGGGFLRSPRGSVGGAKREASDSLDSGLEQEESQSQHTVDGAVVELMFTRAGGYIVYSADDVADLKQIAELLSKDANKTAASVLGKAPSPAEPVGYGLMTTLTFKEVQAELGPAAQNSSDQAGGVLGHFDFVVALAGAQVWHRRSDGAGWVCDTKYEELIDFRWEPSVAKQVLKRLTSGTTGWSKLPINKDGCPQLKMLATGGPYNMQVLVPAGPDGGAAASAKPQPPLDVELLLARLRCKLRKSGIRAQLLASAAGPNVEGASPGALILHITPLRCSRPLALRYLTHRYKVPLGSCTLAVFYAKGAAGKKLEVASSDASDLMGGQQKVALVPGNKAGADKASAGGLHFKVDLTAFDGTGRIKIVEKL